MENEKQYGFYFDQTRCIGCYTCVVACKDWNNIEAGSINYIRIHTIEKGNFPNVFVAFLPAFCYHCADPPCVKSCLPGAIYKRQQDGIVLVDEEKCLGKDICGLCGEACPYGAPQYGEDDHAKMQKCDLCVTRLDEGASPVCVEACRTRALDVGPLDDLREKYGDGGSAVGFIFSAESKPSVVFRPKKSRDVS